MNNYILKYIKPVFFIGTIVLMIFSSCKDNYYFDGGKADPVFKGNMMQYLESKPIQFDTIVQIIKLAGLEKNFQEDQLTFFAPTDALIKRAIGNVTIGGSLNQFLFIQGKDTIQTLADINPEIWNKYIQRYMFKGTYQLKDYPQVDFDLKAIYPGQYTYSYNNTVVNIGVIFNDAGGVKYTGYRQLSISYIPDVSKPLNNWLTCNVASSDIHPDNGYVHSLAVGDGYSFGFDIGEFRDDVYRSK